MAEEKLPWADYCLTTISPDSRKPKISYRLWYAPVAQLDSASDSDSEGRWFESSRAYHKDETIWIFWAERLESQLFRLFVFPDFKIRKNGYFQLFRTTGEVRTPAFRSLNRFQTDGAHFRPTSLAPFPTKSYTKFQCRICWLCTASESGIFFCQKGHPEQFG